jgi:hypothetical protein
VHYPEMGLADDDETPHLIHINAFTDADVRGLMGEAAQAGFVTVEALKVPEGRHEGHTWKNWLIAMRRAR